MKKTYDPRRLKRIEFTASAAHAAVIAVNDRVQKIKDEELKPAMQQINDRALLEFFPQTRKYDPRDCKSSDPRTAAKASEWARRLKVAAEIKQQIDDLVVERRRLSKRANDAGALHASVKDFIQVNRLKALGA